MKTCSMSEIEFIKIQFRQFRMGASRWPNLVGSRWGFNYAGLPRLCWFALILLVSLDFAGLRQFDFAGWL